MREHAIVADQPLAKSKKEHIKGVSPIDEITGAHQSRPLLGGIRLQEAITIGRPRSEIYAFWRDFRNLPTFCKYLEDVVLLDKDKSRWTASGPADRPLTWEAVLVEDVSDKLIVWTSYEKSDFVNAGSVLFRDAPADRGTEIILTFSYNPPLGPLGSLIAKLTAREPAIFLKEQLRRLKQLMETGEIATIDGQPAVEEK